jgi:hypothetical protein
VGNENTIGNGLGEYGSKTFAVSETPEEGYMEQTARRKSSVVDAEMFNGEIYDERFESTKQGLKSRHAQ